MEWKLPPSGTVSQETASLETFLSGMETQDKNRDFQKRPVLETFLSGMETILKRQPVQALVLP